MQTLLALLRQDDVTHVACAFDSEIRSFRNELFEGYKTGDDTPEDLRAQFELAERAVSALGIVVWPMVEFEADDAIATAARAWMDDPQVEQVVICSPDKDLAQVISDGRVVGLDRRRNLVLDEEGVIAKFGVSPKSIPDYLALVGDAADGIPGIPRWGAKSTAQVLQRFAHIEQIPDNSDEWEIKVRGGSTLARNLSEQREAAMLYRELATLRLDVPLGEVPSDLEWNGARKTAYEEICAECGFDGLRNAPDRWAGG